MTAPITARLGGPLAIGEQASALSRAVVQITAEYAGRGPDRVRTTLGADVACVVLRNTFTKSELALIAIGEIALVGDVRRGLHRTMQPALLRAAQAVTGRDVLAVLADHDIPADIATVTFVLAPSPPASSQNNPVQARTSAVTTQTATASSAQPTAV